MSTKRLRILQLSYYPITNALTGGQRRIVNVRRAFDRLGLEHRYVGFIPHRDDGGPNDIVLTPQQSDFLWRKMENFELRIATVVRSCGRLDRRLHGLLAENWDVLWFEHPFLWPAAQPHLTGARRPRIVYDAHNVEWQMKRGLLTGSGQRDDTVVLDVYQAERSLVWNSDLVVAVSRQDQLWFDGAGARKTVLFRNGGDRLGPFQSGTATRLRRELALGPNSRVLLYVSSNHTPNWIGFKELVLDQLEQLRAAGDVRIVVVGGICSRLEQAPWAGHPALCPLGVIDDETKAAIFSIADCVLLPITSGGGTNLKTPEALLTGLPIIATRTAFRGFEEFEALSHVAMASAPAAFAGAILNFVQRPSADLAQQRSTAKDSLDWETLLDSCEWTRLVEGFSDSLGAVLAGWRQEVA